MKKVLMTINFLLVYFFALQFSYSQQSVDSKTTNSNTVSGKENFSAQKAGKIVISDETATKYKDFPVFASTGNEKADVKIFENEKNKWYRNHPEFQVQNNFGNKKETRSVNDSKWLLGGIYENFTPDQEVIEKRTRVAKHFRLSDGSFAAIVGDLKHYKDDDGAWQDIDFTIRNNNSGKFIDHSFANITHEIKSFYSEQPGTSGIIIKKENIQLNFWKNPQTIIYNNSQELKVISANNNKGTISDSKISYNCFSGVTDEFIVGESGIKNNIILNAVPEEITQNPEGTDIGYSQFISLPENYSLYNKNIKINSDFTSESFVIKPDNDSIGFIFTPLLTYDNGITLERAYELTFKKESNKITENELNELQSHVVIAKYRIHFVNGGVVITSVLPISWIKNSERKFPIVIDPNIVIGTGTSTQGYPWYYYWGYTRSASIYTSAEIGATGVLITGAYWYVATSAATSAPIVLRLNTTAATTLVANTWANIISGATTAISGSYGYPTAGGWYGFNALSYSYTSNNLLVMCEANYGGTGTTTPYFNYTTTGTNMHESWYQDNSAPTGNGTINTSRPNIYLSYSSNYCTNTNTTSTAYYISNFSTTGGTTNITNNASGFSANGYGNFTAMSVSKSNGGTVNFSVTSGNGTMGFGIWVDWNQDGDFADANEQMYLSGSYLSSATGSFIVPAGALSGSTRMRVVGNYLNTSPTACTGTGYTECEDYTFIVVPTVMPNNQDCAGAIALCQSTYNNATSYVGTGNYTSEIPTTGGCPANCLLSGEKNDVWYTFTVQSPGTVAFQITPVQSSDDYDWAVYNLTNADCADIYNNTSLQVSCNYSATDGVTGPNGGSGLTCGTASDVPFNAALTVQAGQTYAVNVSNFSSTQYGYNIYFNAYNGAQVIDNVPPSLYSIASSPVCGQNQVTVRFSENVLCSTVQNSSFTISGNGGPYTVTNVYSPICNSGGSYDRDFVLTVSPAFTSGGTYVIGVVADIVTDICGQSTDGQTLNFSVTGVSASASVNSNVNCYGQANGSATASGSGGTAPYTYLWSNSSTSATATGLAAGTYNVTVRDALGVCNAVSTVTISQPTNLTSSITKTDVNCNGGNTGAATVTGFGGTLNYSYLWSTGSTSTSISGLTAATYTVTVTDAHGCTSVSSTTLTQPTALSTAITASTNVACFGGNNGSATVFASGGTPSYTYTWSNGNNTATATGLVAGTYTVTVRDAYNCSSIKSVTISQPTTLTSSISASTQVSCNGGNNGSATVSQSGGTSPYNYTWSNSQTTVTAINLTAGTYFVTVRDVNNCSSVSSVAITQPTAVAVSLTKTNVLCNGGNNGTATATPSGGTGAYTYIWSNGQTTPTATGLSAIAYSVTVKDANNCSVVQSITITQPTTLTSSITASTNVACNGGSNGTATVTGSGGTISYTYLWSNSQTGATATSLSVGTYTVTVRDANNCSSISSIAITQPTVLTSSTTSTLVLCNGNSNGTATAIPSGGTSPYTYLWSNSQTTATATGLAAGTYNVTVRDVNNCSTTASVTVSQPTVLTTSISSSTNVSCSGGNNGSATVGASGGTPSYTYLWSNSQTGATATGLIAGTYFVTVRDANNCSSTRSVTITQPTVLSTTASATNTSCNSGSNGSATASPSGGTAPYTYNWFPSGQTTNPATGLSAGTYSVTVTDSKGCSAINSTTVISPAALGLTTGKTDATCGNSNGSASVSVSGGTSPYTYLWSTGGTGTSISSIAAGSYSVTVRDANNCSNTATVSVNNTGAPTVTPSSPTNVTCFGGSNGSASITASGGTSPYTYLWSNGATGTSITNVTANTYSVTVTDAIGCKGSTSVVVSQPTAVNASVTGNVSPLCFGANNGSATASASGGTGTYTYLWSNGANTSTASSLIAGNYTVTVRDANNCSSTASVTVTQPTQISSTISSSTNVSCFGGSNGTATVTPSGGTPGYTYLWSQGSTTAAATNLSSGTYTVTVKDFNNCSVTSNVTITQPTILSSTISKTNVLCNGGNTGTATVTASGGTVTYTYLWSNSQTTANASGLIAGTYTITVTDSKGCTTTNSVTVTEPTVLSASISASTNVLCNGGSTGSATVTQTGGTSTYTYLWSNTQTTATATGLSLGTYTVTVRDANNCTASTSIAITQPTALSSSISASTNVSCNGGNNGSATASPTGGTPAYNYLWSNSQTASTANTLIAGTYSVTIRDANNCSSVSTVTITQPAVLTSSISSSTQVSCSGGNNGSSTVTPVGGTPAYTYTWSNGQTTAIATSLVAGNYTVTVKDVNNCTSTSSVTITQPTQLTSSISSSTQVSCNGGNNGTATVTQSGGTSGYIYLWTNSQTVATATGLSSGTYTVTVTDSKGCTSTSSVTITQPTVLTSSISASTQVLCFGGSSGTATVTQSGGTPGYTYLWSNSQTTSTATGLAIGTYVVTVKDANNCTSTSSVTITQPAQLTSSISASTNVNCNGGNNGSATVLPVGGTPAYTYFWSTGQSVATTTNLTSGTYTVTITDSKGCSSTSSVTITQPAVLNLTTVVSNTTCNGGSNGSVNSTPTGGTGPYTYSWFPGSQTTQNVTGLTAGTYQVTITDSHSCTYFTSAIVNEPASLHLTPSFVNATCGNSNGSASISVTGGTPAYTYLWSNAATTSSISSIIAGTYTVTVRDANLCSNTATISVNNTGAPSISLVSSTNVSCNGGNNGGAEVTVTGGTLPYTSYLWSLGMGTGTVITGASANNYSITVTDANNCQATLNVNITQPPALVVSITGTTIPSCYGTSDGSATANTNGGTPSYFYNWSSGSTTAYAGGLASGVYTVTVTDSKGCTSTTTANVTQPTQVTAFISAYTNVTCNGGGDGSATVLPSGGTSGYTYLWSSGASTATATNLSATTYTVTVYDSHSCTTVTSTSIGQPAALQVNIPSVTNVTCFGGATGQATASVSGGSGPYTYLWSNGTTTVGTTSLIAGPYSLTVTDTHGCTGTNTITITEPSMLTATANPMSPVGCFGGNNGSATALGSGGMSPYSYHWSNNGSFQNTGGLSAGIHSVTITDINSCTAVATVTITEPALMVVNYVSDSVLCNGTSTGNIDLTVAGGTSPYSYHWNNNSLNEDLSNVIAGTYLVTVTDVNFCSQIQTITVLQPSAVTATFTPVDAHCNQADGLLTVNASGGSPGYTYLWDANAGGQTTVTASNLYSGSYMVTVTDIKACTFVFTGALSDLNAASINFDVVVNNNCFGDTLGYVHAVTNGGTLPFNYHWSNASVADTIFNVGAGDYVLTVTDATGCITIDTATVGQPQNIQVTVDSLHNISCFGLSDGYMSVGISGGTPGYTYQWQDGSSNVISTISSISSVPAGLYYLTITDNHSCVQTFNSLISQQPALTSTILAPQLPLCFNSHDGVAIAQASGGTSPYSYLWNDALNTANDTVATLVGNADYIVTATDANGCTSTDTIHLNAPTQVQISMFGFPASCTSSNGWAYADVTGGTPSYSFNWSNGVQNNDTINGLASGTYLLTVTDIQGCSSINSVSIINVTAGQIHVDNVVNINCYGLATGVIEVSMIGGTPPLTYLWSNLATTDSLANLSPGLYSVTITDSNGCLSDTSVTLTGPSSAATSTFSVSNVTCYRKNDGTVSVIANGGTSPYTYLWNTGATTASLMNIPAATYSITATDAHGCIITNSATISEPDSLQALTSSINPTCGNGADGSVLVSVSGGTIPYSYLWSNGDLDSLANGLAGDSTYIVTITDFNSCIQIANAHLFNPSAMILDTSSGKNAVTYLGFINVAVTGGASPYDYTWSNGATTANLIDLPAGEYTVTISDANSCSVVATFNIDITLLIPTVITPNKDGFNDDFQILGIGGYLDVTIEIYNRWGDVLFVFSGSGMEYVDAAKRWNGEYQGKELPMGSYVYIIKLGEDEDPVTGVVSIVR